MGPVGPTLGSSQPSSLNPLYLQFSAASSRESPGCPIWARSSATAATIVCPFLLISVCYLPLPCRTHAAGTMPVSPRVALGLARGAQAYLLNQRMKTYVLNQRVSFHSQKVLLTHLSLRIRAFLFFSKKLQNLIFKGERALGSVGHSKGCCPDLRPRRPWRHGHLAGITAGAAGAQAHWPGDWRRSSPGPLLPLSARALAGICCRR